MLKHLLLAGIPVAGGALKIDVRRAAQVFLDLPLPGLRVGHAIALMVTRSYHTRFRPGKFADGGSVPPQNYRNAGGNVPPVRVAFCE